MIHWLPKAAILVIHSELIAEHGGLPGPANEDSLDSTLARAQQLAHYGVPTPSLFQLAASYGFGFAKNHCFKDGNKRISLVSIDIFLQLNGFELVAEEAEAAVIIESLAAGSISEAELATWIEKNSINISDQNE